MSEPKPWRSDASAPAPLRDLLARAASARAPASDRAAMERGLSALFAAPVAAPPVAAPPVAAPPLTSPPGVSLVRGTYLMRGGVALLLLAGGVAAWRLWPAPVEPAPVMPPPAPVVIAVAPPPAPEPALPEEEAPAIEPARPARAAARAERELPNEAVAESPEEEAPPEAARPSEIALLRAARSLLSSDPRGALSNLEDHETFYPNGVFAEERDALTVQALLGMGRRAEAQRRADQLFAAHPDTAHRARLLELLGEE